MILGNQFFVGHGITAIRIAIGEEAYTSGNHFVAVGRDIDFDLWIVMILTDKFLVGQKTLKHVAIGLLEEFAELLDLCVAGRFARLQTHFRDFFEVSAAFQTQSVGFASFRSR